MLTPLDPDLVRFAGQLEAHDIPCMVVGSVASTVWGEPRSTLDATGDRAWSQGHLHSDRYPDGLKADIYPGATDPLNAWGMAGSGAIVIAPVSCVIAGKLRYCAMSTQDKHRRDIRGMLRLSMADVDRAFIDEVARQQRVEDAWMDCLSRPGAQ